ncbi:ATPase, partial [Micromonospora sp. NPDC000018]
LPEVAPLLAYGASPRATLGLVAAARAQALLRGREYVVPEDIRELAVDVLAHRLVLSFDAVADGVSAESLVRRLVEAVPPPRVATGHPEFATDLAAA